MSLRLENFEREHHVVRSDRAPVVKPGLRAEPVRRPGAVVGDLDPFREESVRGGCLVRRILRQRIEEESDLRRRIALDDEGVEAVVGRSDRCPAHRSSLGSVRIDVVVVQKVGRVPGCLADGNRMADDAPRLGGRGGGEECTAEQGESGGRRGCGAGRARGAIGSVPGQVRTRRALPRACVCPAGGSVRVPSDSLVHSSSFPVVNPSPASIASAVHAPQSAPARHSRWTATHSGSASRLYPPSRSDTTRPPACRSAASRTRSLIQR